MKNESEPFSNVNYLLSIGLTAFIMCLLASCGTIKKNINSNYQAKSNEHYQTKMVKGKSN